MTIDSHLFPFLYHRKKVKLLERLYSGGIKSIIHDSLYSDIGKLKFPFL